MIVLLAGLPGTGKTTLARALAARTSGRVLSKDEFRHSLFAEEEIEYSTRQDDFCLRIMLETAAYLLQQNRGRAILLDGRPFSRRYQIENAIRTANSLSQRWCILECICDEKIVERRIGEDLTTASHQAKNRNFELYLEIKNHFEQIGQPKTIIDTTQSINECVERSLRALGLSAS